MTPEERANEIIKTLSLEVIENKSGMISIRLHDLVVKAIREAQAEQREKDCKSICIWCETGKTGNAEFDGFGWHHRVGNYWYHCAAAAIRNQDSKVATNNVSDKEAKA